MRNTETSTPRCSSVRATTNPSPPLLPRPHSTATRPSSRSLWTASIAATTWRPAFSISTSDGMPISSIVRRSASRICAAFRTRIDRYCTLTCRLVGHRRTGARCVERELLVTVRSLHERDGQCQRPSSSIASTRSFPSSIMGFSTAKACTRRCAPTTASRSCSTATCGGCGRRGDAVARRCRSPTTKSIGGRETR